MNLSEFLLARVAEDERVAKWSGGLGDFSGIRGLGDGAGFEVVWEGGDIGGEYALHADPARVLAERAAKRALIELHSADHSCVDGSYFGGAPCSTHRILAQPYADHPDYQSEWSPR